VSTPIAVAPRLRSGFRRFGLLTLGGALVLAFVVSALFAPQVAPHDPYALDVGVMLQGPSPDHPLGTDELGRDILSRTVYAARISMQVALIAVAVGLVGGTVIGVMAAYFGGWVDLVLMRLMELLFSFPAILLAVILMASLGTSALNAMIAIGIIFIPGFARLARASTNTVLRQSYIDAARCLGMGDLRIMASEILPNILAPSLVEAAVAVAYAVLLESALSFLGLGAQPPEPSWGNMLSTGRGFMEQAPWLGIVPGLAMFLCVLGFNLLGDGLRDVLDPRQS
jgi:peptide/nickel transport system permease protein